MKQAFPLTLFFLMSISHHIHAVELLVLPGDRYISSMSHDGSRFVVTQTVTCCPDRRFSVTTLDDPTNLNRLDDLDLAGPGTWAHLETVSMSDSGEYIAGDVNEVFGVQPESRLLTLDPLPAWWNLEGEMESLALPTGKTTGSAWAFSDGGVAVGTVRDDDSPNHGYRWTIGGDGAFLLPLPSFERSESLDISADGRVAVGFSQVINDGDRINEATMWISSGPDDIDVISIGSDAISFLVSSDGSAVAGFSGDETFLWTADDGIVSLGRLPGETMSRPLAISSDGKVVVGGTNFGRGNRSWVWDAGHGMRGLEAVLVEEHGVDTSVFEPVHGNFRLKTMSADSKAIGGRYVDGESTNVAFYLDRPLVVTSGVTGDFNGNAELDAGDLDLLAAELQTDRNVDLFDVNADGDVTDADRAFWVTDLSETYFGDANLDRTVDFSDFLSLSANFGEEGGWANGDFDGNGQTDFPDFLLLSENFGASSANASTASVPEPSSCLLLTIGLLALRRMLPRSQTGRGMAQGAT